MRSRLRCRPHSSPDGKGDLGLPCLARSDYQVWPNGPYLGPVFVHRLELSVRKQRIADDAREGAIGVPSPFGRSRRAMWEHEIRLGVGSVMTVLLWLAAGAFLTGGWLRDDDRLALIGVAVTVGAGVMTVVRDNCVTRRVVRAVARESSVRQIHQ